MPQDRQKIRVGIVRCDTHGYWYAPLFERPDPELYRKHHRGCHYYFFEPAAPEHLRFPTVPGMEITRVWDAERARAAGLAACYHDRPKVCDTYAEVSEDVDLVYIADCNEEGKDHLEFATPGLQRGVPHFIDKPFAFELADARAIVALAQRHGTAVLSCSLMRYSPYLDNFRQCLSDIAPVGTLHVQCGGPSLAALFHGLSLIQCVLGEGCEAVESMGPVLYDVMRLHYPPATGGVRALLFNARGAAPREASAPGAYVADHHHCAYHASAYGAEGAVHSPRIDDFRFPHAGVRIVRMAREMALTKKPPIPYRGMLELMEIIEAARLAHNAGRRVCLKELRA